MTTPPRSQAAGPGRPGRRPKHQLALMTQGAQGADEPDVQRELAHQGMRQIEAGHRGTSCELGRLVAQRTGVIS